MSNQNMGSKLELGLFKQAIMKIDAAQGDMYEIIEDGDLDEENRETMTRLCEMLGVIEASLVNIVRKEMDGEELLNESFPMDEIDEYPGASFMKDEDGLLNQEI